MCCSAAVTIGFERETYDFREPPTGVNERTEEVCLIVIAGALGTDLGIVSEFIAGTATGELMQTV